MKITEFIEELEKIKEEMGDLECYFCSKWMQYNVTNEYHCIASVQHEEIPESRGVVILTNWR